MSAPCVAFAASTAERASRAARLPRLPLQRLVGVLMRNFWWFENVLWLDDELDAAADPRGKGVVSLFISERDRYMDGPVAYSDALAAREKRQAEAQAPRPRRELRAVLWKDQDHGDFLKRSEQRRAVVDSLLIA